MAFPAEHYMMMGMHKYEDLPIYGPYNDNDFNFTVEILRTSGSVRAREENIRMIRERLRDFGFFGYMEFLEGKLRWITGDGTFFWGFEGYGGTDGLSTLEFEGMSEAHSFFRNLLYPSGGGYEHYTHMAQGIWLFNLMWMFLFAFCKKDCQNAGINICILAAAGSLLFILLFEGRSRYLINHLPYFCVISSYCFLKVTDALQDRYHIFKR
jgi:hypothetical protein